MAPSATIKNHQKAARNVANLKGRMPRPRIGVLPTGHKIYWGQFPNLKALGEGMYSKLCSHLAEIGDVIAPELVDTPEKAVAAASFFQANPIDILLIFPFGYTTGMCIAPVVRKIHAPIRLLNAHEDSTYDYRNADTAIYLHHEGVCCIPEYSGTLVNLGKSFRVITGHFGDPRLWDELAADCQGASAARAFQSLNCAVIIVCSVPLGNCFCDPRWRRSRSLLSMSQMPSFPPCMTNSVLSMMSTRPLRMSICGFLLKSLSRSTVLFPAMISTRSDTTGGAKMISSPRFVRSLRSLFHV